MRRKQIAAWKKARPTQPALFDLKDYRRPESARTAAGRSCEPTLLAWLQDAGGGAVALPLKE